MPIQPTQSSFDHEPFGRGDASSDPFQPGTVIDGRYRVLGVLGEGGQGRVYRAEHAEIGTPLAIKVARTDDQDGPPERFAREARIGAQVRHRNVVGVLDVGTHEGIPYLVMELVEGETLADVLAVTTLPPAATIELGIQLLAALHALEEQRIVHRDIKPENIVLHRAVDGEVVVKLLDFGVSKSPRPDLAPTTVTVEGMVVGTPLYMSPERVRGAPGDVRSDLYAVGAVLYECLAGVVPHPGAAFAEVLASILERTPVPLRDAAPQCPEALAEVIEVALAKDPDARFPHPAVMAERLREVFDELGLRRSDEWAGVVGVTGNPPARESIVVLRGLRRAGVRRSFSSGWRAMFGRLKTMPSEASLATTWPRVVLKTAGSGFGLVAVAALTWTLVTAALGAPAPAEKDRSPLPSAVEAAAVERAASPLPPIAAPVDDVGSIESLERGARDLFLRGEPVAAVALYRQVVERDPDRAEAWRDLGLSAEDAGERALAEASFRRYLALRPDAADAAAIRRRLSAGP